MLDRETMGQVEIPKDIVEFAEDLIRSGEEGFEIIKLRVLETEEDQHDDDLIDSVIQEFSEVLKGLTIQLEKEFGSPKLSIYDEDEDDIEEEDEDEFYVPCSFSSAVWAKNEHILYLSVLQEDREFPICLVVGVEY